MKQDVEQELWVAIRVERGFPVEVRGFRKRAWAIRTERDWRKKMNPDYDETGVLPLDMPAG